MEIFKKRSFLIFLGVLLFLTVLLYFLLDPNGQIFFPKLNEDQMKTFSSIGISFLKEFGNYEPEFCATEQEAREKAEKDLAVQKAKIKSTNENLSKLLNKGKIELKGLTTEEVKFRISKKLTPVVAPFLSY